MENMMDCAKCACTPVRKSEAYQTWLECPKCHSKGGACNPVSDDYAFTRTVSYWNRRQREREANEDARSIAAEAYWKEKQGDEYGSY